MENTVNYNTHQPSATRELTDVKETNFSQIKIYEVKDFVTQALESLYCQTAKEFAIAMINAGYSYEDNDELITMAVQATNKLIEKTSNHLAYMKEAADE